jgi:hypothetical protein
MKKSLWRAHFSQQFVPKFPCPNCEDGYLKVTKDRVRTALPAYAKSAQAGGRYPPERFVMFLECSDLACGEVVAVAGDAISVPETDPNDRSEVYEYLEPVIMSPAPPLITLPAEMPDSVKREIKLAFGLFWTDYRVAASRLRTSLERLMDHFGVAKTRIQKDQRNPNTPGKRKLLELAVRIDMLPKKIGTRDYSDILHALRVIGNLGTHGTRVSHAAILDAFQLYEIALGTLFEDESESAKAIIKRLKKSE